MRVIGKKMATGLLGGVLSIVPVSKASANKLAYSMAGDINSNTAMLKVSEKLNGVSKDTYDASKKFVNSPSKSSKASKAAQQVPPKNINIEKFLIESGSKLVANTNKSKIYEISKATALKLEFHTVEGIGDYITKIEMAVPKTANVKIADCSIACTLKPTFEESAGLRDDKWTTVFVKGSRLPKSIELHQTTTSEGKALCTLYTQFLQTSEKGFSKIHFSETHFIVNNGIEKFKYTKEFTKGFADSNKGKITIDKAEFEGWKNSFLEDFEELYERSSVKTKKAELQKEAKVKATNAANKAIKDELKEKIASKEREIALYKSLVQTQEQIRNGYMQTAMIESDFSMKQMYMNLATAADTKIKELNKIINNLSNEKAKLIEQLEKIEVPEVKVPRFSLG